MVQGSLGGIALGDGNVVSPADLASVSRGFEHCCWGRAQDPDRFDEEELRLVLEDLEKFKQLS